MNEYIAALWIESRRLSADIESEFAGYYSDFGKSGVGAYQKQEQG